MPKSFTRGMRAETNITWITANDEAGNTKKLPVMTNTHVLGKRMGKNTRASDILGSGIKRKRKTHTSPVTRVVNAHMDETGARDPSRMRHAVTKKRRATYRTNRANLCKAMMFMLSDDFVYDSVND